MPPHFNITALARGYNLSITERTLNKVITLNSQGQNISRDVTLHMNPLSSPSPVLRHSLSLCSQGINLDRQER